MNQNCIYKIRHFSLLQLVLFCFVLCLVSCSGAITSGITNSVSQGITTADNPEAGSQAAPTEDSATGSTESESDTENEVQAILPPPSLDHFTLTRVSQQDGESYAVLQGNGFDSSYDGHYVVATHTQTISAAHNTSAPLSLPFIGTAWAATQSEVCTSSEANVRIYCMQIDNGTIEDTVIADYQDGESLTLAIFNPSEGSLSETTSTFNEFTENLIYTEEFPYSRETSLVHAGAYFFTTADGKIFKLDYNDSAVNNFAPDLGRDTGNLQFTQFTVAAGYEIREFEINPANSEYTFRIEATSNSSNSSVSSHDFSSDTFTFSSDTASFDCHYTNDCRPILLKSMAEGIYFAAQDLDSGTCTVSEFAAYPTDCAAPAVYNFAFSASDFGDPTYSGIYPIYDLDKSDPVDFYQMFAFDATGNSTTESNAIMYFEQLDGGGFPRFYFYHWDTYNNSDQIYPASSGSSYADLGLFEGADVVDLKIISPAGISGSAFLTSQDGVFFIEYTDINSVSHDINIQPFSSSVALGNVIDVAYNTDTSMAYLLSNASASDSDDDFITAIDLTNQTNGTSAFPAVFDPDTDGRVYLRDVISDYTGDIDPVSIDFYSVTTTENYLLVSSRTLNGVIVVPLQ